MEVLPSNAGQVGRVGLPARKGTQREGGQVDMLGDEGCFLVDKLLLLFDQLSLSALDVIPGLVELGAVLADSLLGRPQVLSRLICIGRVVLAAACREDENEDGPEQANAIGHARPTRASARPTS